MLNRRAFDFETAYHASVKQILPTYLALTMEVLQEMRYEIKNNSSDVDGKEVRTDAFLCRTRLVADLCLDF